MGEARPYKPGEHKGSLYQLKTTALPGHPMLINGPYDKYGRVISHKPNGFHLIRGIGFMKPSDWKD